MKGELQILQLTLDEDEAYALLAVLNLGAYCAAAHPDQNLLLRLLYLFSTTPGDPIPSGAGRAINASAAGTIRGHLLAFVLASGDRRVQELDTTPPADAAH